MNTFRSMVAPPNQRGPPLFPYKLSYLTAVMKDLAAQLERTPLTESGCLHEPPALDNAQGTFWTLAD